MDTLEARITLLEDRLALSELRSRYCFLVDQGKAREAVDLFTDDCEFHGPDKSYYGREEQISHYESFIFSNMWHFVTNEITNIKGQSASGLCYCYMPCVYEGKSYVCACQYEDAMERIDGIWKFRSRKVTFYFFVPLDVGWGKELLQFPSGH